MRFTYDGFTQQGDRRCFRFRATENNCPPSSFSIEIDLQLLLKNLVPVQAAPMFCLNLLTDASQGNPDALERLRRYTVVGDDFRKLHLERERQAAAKLSQKLHRRPFRKPSRASNLWIGSSPGNSQK